MWFLQTPVILFFSGMLMVVSIYLRMSIFNACKEVTSLSTKAFHLNYSLIGYTLLLCIYANRFPLAFDEAFTFNRFITESFNTIISRYPQPNNHVFHSILCRISWQLFSWIPGPLPIRLPAILISSISFNLIQHYFLKRSSVGSMLLLLVAVLSTNFFQFSFQARGYAFQTCFSLFSFILIQQKQIPFKTRYAGFILFCFLGLYTVPTYVFTAMALGTFWFFDEPNAFKSSYRMVGIITLWGIMLTLLAYTPIMRIQGVDALFNNKFVQSAGPVSLTDIAHYSINLGNFLFLPFPLSALIPLLFIFFIIQQQHVARLAIIITPLVMLFALNQQPKYLRIFLPIAFLITTLVLAYAVPYIQQRIQHKLHTIIVCTFTITGIVIGLYYFENMNEKNDFNTAFRLKEINEQINQAHKVYLYHIYWHLNEGLLAQRIYDRKPWIKPGTQPELLLKDEVLLSSDTLNLICTDTFKSRKGQVYLYRGQ